MSKKHSLASEVAAQTRWIEEHGGTLAGYVARYGSADDPRHYGNGGEAIWAADIAVLDRLLAGRPRPPKVH